LIAKYNIRKSIEITFCIYGKEKENSIKMQQNKNAMKRYAEANQQEIKHRKQSLIILP